MGIKREIQNNPEFNLICRNIKGTADYVVTLL